VGSVTRTGRLAVCHEAPAAFGPGNEIIAVVLEDAFWKLDAPPLRIAPAAFPAPYAPVLEKAWMPDRVRLVQELRALSQV